MIRILKKIFTSFVILSFVNSVAFAQSISNNALPTNPNVTSGSANISQTANKLTVNQNTDKLITNWSSFNIGKDATVQFIQPSSTASALNRVTSSDPSYIFGTLQANGKIILINPNGVLFANGAKVDVGSIIASTLNMVDKDYSSDQLIFEKGNLAGTIQNDGTIRAFAGGTVALVGSQVTNNGKIKTKQGTTALLAGDKVTLTLNGNRLIKYTIDQGALNSLVENNNAIIAKEGVVILSAKGLNLLSKSVVNNTGTIEAKGFSQSGGKIYLDGDQTTNSGKLVASSKNNSGGLIQVTGDEVKLTSTASLDASGATGGGTVLVGGDYQGKNPLIKNASLLSVDQGTYINADATLNGDGGKVILWSDQSTNFAGNISAKGGSLLGDGGFAEVSSKNLLGYKGTVDLTAANGKVGNLLLDPADILIKTGEADAITGSNISPTTLLTSLAGANLTLSATNSISIYDNIAYTGATARTLTFTSESSTGAKDKPIALGADISSSSGTLGLTFNGNLYLTKNSTLTTNGGALALSSNVGGPYTLTANLGTGAFSTGAAINGGFSGNYKTSSSSLTGTCTSGLPTCGTLTNYSFNTDIGKQGNGTVWTIDFVRGKVSYAIPRGASGDGTGTLTGVPTANSIFFSNGSTFSFALPGNSVSNISYTNYQTGTVTSIAGSGPANAAYPITLPANTYISKITFTVGTNEDIKIVQNTVPTVLSSTIPSGSGGGTTASITSAETLGSLVLEGTGANTVGGNITTTNAIDLKGTSRSTTLGANTTLTTTNSNVSLGAVTGGSNSLTIAARTVGTAPATTIGAASGLSNLTITTGTLSASAIGLNTNGALTVNNYGDGSITGIISGTGATLTKDGTGILTLSNTSNSYSGATTVSAGTLSISADTNLGTAPGSATAGQLNLNSGTLETTAGLTLASNRGIALGTGDGTIQTDTGTLTYGGIIAGSNALTKTGTGTLTLTGANTYSAGTTISAGTLQIGSGGTAGSVAGNITDNAALIFNRSDDITYASAISGTGTVTKSGSNTLTLTSGSNSYTGETTISGGTLKLSGSGVLGSLGGLDGYTAQITNNGIFQYSSSASQTLTGKITGTGSILKDTNTTVLEIRNSTNDYSGSTTVNAGNIQVGSDNSIPSSSAVILGSGGYIQLNGFNDSIGSLSGSGKVMNYRASNTLTIGNDNTTTTFSGVIQNTTDGVGGSYPVSLTKIGSGTLNLSGLNTYSGTTTISAGTLNISGTGSLASGTYSGSIVDNSNFTYSSSTDQILSGVISGTGTLTKDTSSSSTLTLSNANSYTGTTSINAGTLAISNGSALGGASSGQGTTVASGATLGISGGISVAEPITISGAGVSSGGAIKFTGTTNTSNTYSGAITLAATSTINSVVTSGQQTISSTINGTSANSEALTVTASGPLTLSGGSVGQTTSLSTFNASTTSGNLTLGENIKTGSTGSSSIVLNAGSSASVGGTGSTSSGNIIISGSPVLTTGTGGTAKLFTGSISDSTGLTSFIGSASGKFRYNSDETTTNYATALSSGNYAIYRQQPTLTITANNPVAITYGSSLPSFATTVSGYQNGDTLSQSISTSASVAIGGSTSTSGNYIAGSHTLTPSGAAGGLGYGLSYANGSLTINQLALTGSIATGSSTYGSVLGSAGVATLTNVVSGDLVTANTALTATVTDPSLANKSTSGNLKASTYASAENISSLNSGNGNSDANNYTYSAITGSYTVNPKGLTISGITAANKEYDGGLSATVDFSGVSKSGLITNDLVTVTSVTGAFTDKHAGSSKTASLTSAYGGNDKNNYTITDQASATATITAKTLTPTITNTSVTKEYDSTTATSITPTYSFSGFVSGDTAAILTHDTKLYNSKNVNDANKVTVSGLGINSITGTNSSLASDYSLSSSSKDVNATITTKTLTVSGITAANKDFDGTTAATVSTSGAVYSGKVSGDSVTVSATGTFASAAVGTGKTVNLTNTYTGTDVTNYNITNQSTTTANITNPGETPSEEKKTTTTTKSRCQLSDCNKSKLVSGEIVIVKKNIFNDDKATVTPISINPDIQQTPLTKPRDSLVKIIILKPGAEPVVDKEYQVTIRGNDAILKENMDVADKTITSPGKSIGSARFSIENDKGKILEYNLVVRESGLEIRPLSFEALQFADKNKATVAGAAMIDVVNNLKLSVDNIKTIILDLIIDKVFEEAMFNSKGANKNIFNVNYY